MTPKVTAGCILLDDTGKILLIRRNTEPFKDYWSIPGGKVEMYEKVEDCVRREVKEEISIEIKNLKFLNYENEIFPEKHIHYIGHIFKGTISGKIKLQEKEVKEYGMFSLAEIKKMKIGFGHKTLLLKYGVVR